MNMLSKRKAARRRALRAVQAVSIGGVAFVAQGCGTEAGTSGDDDVTSVDGAVSPDTEIDVPEQDIRVDAAEDVAEDVEADTEEDAELDSTDPDVVPDVPSDVVEEVAEDVSVEVGEDTATDTTPEDVAQDVAMDTASDVPPDMTEPDAPEDIGEDTAEEVAEDTTDGGDSCEPEEDNLCPENCTQDNDWDCCQRFIDETGLPCFFDPGFGCSCAAVGPFNPPAMHALNA